jgi:hypothetical protein
MVLQGSVTGQLLIEPVENFCHQTFMLSRLNVSRLLRYRRSEQKL